MFKCIGLEMQKIIKMPASPGDRHFLIFDTIRREVDKERCGSRRFGFAQVQRIKFWYPASAEGIRSVKTG